MSMTENDGRWCSKGFDYFETIGLAHGWRKDETSDLWYFSDRSLPRAKRNSARPIFTAEVRQTVKRNHHGGAQK